MARTIYVAVAFMIATVVVQATCPTGYEHVVDGHVGSDAMTFSSSGEAGVVVSIQACSNLCTSNQQHVAPGDALSPTCVSFEWRIEDNPPAPRCYLNDGIEPAHVHSGNSAVWTYCKASLRLPVGLGTAGGFVLLTKSGVTTAPSLTGTGETTVNGNMGTSPIAAAAITGFDLVLDSSNLFSTSALVNGEVTAANYLGTTPTMLTQAISDMETAYTDAAGRVIPDTIERGAGNIEGHWLLGGLHKWSSSVGFSALSFDARHNEHTVWILQIAGDLILGTGAKVELVNGAKASNIFWQVAGQTQIPAGAQAKGIILCATSIIFGDGSSLNGRGLAQTDVTMIATTITAP